MMIGLVSLVVYAAIQGVMYILVSSLLSILFLAPLTFLNENKVKRIYKEKFDSQKDSYGCYICLTDELSKNKHCFLC